MSRRTAVSCAWFALERLRTGSKGMFLLLFVRGRRKTLVALMEGASGEAIH
jgi:hypothetical protein